MTETLAAKSMTLIVRERKIASLIICLLMTIFVADLVTIGDPSLEVKVSRRSIKCLEIRCSRRNQLALGLLEVLCQPSVLATSTISGSRDSSKKALDPNIVEAIRSILILHFYHVCCFSLLF